MADNPAREAPAPHERPEAAEATEAHVAPRILDRIPPSDLIGIGALIAALAAAFWPQMAWMWERWMSSEYYGHGVFIPPIAAYLIYRRREALAALPKSRDGAGLALVVAAMVVHLAGCRVDVNFVSAFALVMAIGGAIWWRWGRDVAAAIAFPIAYLGFMVPVDRLLIDGFSSPLQLIAAQLGTSFAQAVGIPVIREGVNLLLHDYAFEVAIACSGLKSSITLVALAALYAYMHDGGIVRKSVLVASSVPVALLANAVRVGAILVVAQSLGPKAAEGFFHSFSGIVVFVVGLACIYALGRAIGCRNLRDDI